MTNHTSLLTSCALWLKRVGAVILLGMALLTCVDVIGRLFKHPIFGSVELVSFMGVLAIAASLPFTHAEKGHISVELLVRRLPRRYRWWLSLVTETLCLALFSIITWRMFLYAGTMRASGELSMNLQLPEYMIIYVLACCMGILCLVIFHQILQIIAKVRAS